MKIDPNKAEGIVLDWLVAKAAGYKKIKIYKDEIRVEIESVFWKFDPSTNWTLGGLVLDTMDCLIEKTDRNKDEKYWCAGPSIAESWHNHPVGARGPTLLITIMRCYVMQRLGDDLIEIPEDLH